jgi:mutator protein MutT
MIHYGRMKNKNMASLHSLISQAQKDGVDRLNVAAIIVNADAKVLFCQRSLFKKTAPGQWHIPGGRVEKNETVEETIKRELQEELKLQTIQVHSFSNVTHEYLVGNEKHRTVFVLIEAQGKIVLNPENTTYAFLAIEDLNTYLKPENLAHNKEAFAYALKHKVMSDVS